MGPEEVEIYLFLADIFKQYDMLYLNKSTFKPLIVCSLNSFEIVSLEYTCIDYPLHVYSLKLSSLP